MQIAEWEHACDSCGYNPRESNHRGKSMISFSFGSMKQQFLCLDCFKFIRLTINREWEENKDFIHSELRKTRK